MERRDARAPTGWGPQRLQQPGIVIHSLASPCATADWLRAPHSRATTVSWSNATSGTGSYPGRHPYARRGSGTTTSASASDPTAGLSTTGTAFRL